MLRYKLDNLGWFQFESMIQSLLKVEFGIGIESWGGRGDYGRDAFFKGSLEFPRKGQVHEGPFIFQAKFVGEANAAGAKPRPRIIAAVKSEVSKLGIGKYAENASVYVLLTNVTLSPEVRKEIIGLIQSAFPHLEAFALGGRDLCDLLDNYPNIRSAFPQILGLQDLETLLTNVIAKPIIERSRGMIEEARELAPVFYPTESYSKTFSKLTKHSFAVLEGPPEVGKTATARMIALARLSVGWEAHECLSPDEFFHLFAPEKRQVFVADDAFGSTEYDPTRAHDWSYSLDRILRRLDKKHWLIWTARKHILEIALDRMRLQGKGENFPEPGTVLVDVGSLTTTEKAMMLYRHAKAAGLEEAARELVKEYAELIVQHRHFTPERIRRFVSSSLSSLVQDFESGHLKKETVKAKIDTEIREPTKSLKQAFEYLPQEHKRFLISRLDLSRKGFFIDQSDLISSYERHSPRESDRPYEKIEKDLLLSFLSETHFDEGWIHPSIRDLVIDYLTTMHTERHNFLSVCSTSGVSLALSVGGGDRGNRSFPLVVDSHDMEAIKSRVKALVLELPPERFSDLLKITYESKRRCKELQEQRIVTFIEELYETTLVSILKRWEAQEEVPDNQLLQLFYQMAELSKSFLQSPPLGNVWKTALNKFEQTIEEATGEGRFDDVTPIEDMLELVGLLQKEEPRFLKHIGFPSCISEQVTTFFEILAKEAQAIVSFEGEEEDLYQLYMDESERFESLRRIGDEILLLDIETELEEDAGDILSKLDEQVEYYKEEAEQYYFPEPDYEGESGAGSAVSIQSLFSDL